MIKILTFWVPKQQTNNQLSDVIVVTGDLRKPYSFNMDIA